MRRHTADTISLVFGLIFVGIATWWLVGRFVEIRIPNLGWILAAALILAGLVGVAGSLRTDRAAAPDQPTPDQPTPDQPTPDQPTPDQPTPDQPIPGGSPSRG